VLETMDGGKPIKESRDVDLPLVAAHFFYYAGWADKLNYAFPAENPNRWCRRPDHSLELPPAHGAWKIAPALACATPSCSSPPKPPASRDAAREDLPGSRAADGVVILLPAPAHRRCARHHPEVDKIAFTGSTEVGKLIARTLAQRSAPRKLSGQLGAKANGKKRAEQELALRNSHWSSAAKPPIFSSKTPHRPGYRRRHRGHLFQPGPRLLRRLTSIRSGGHLSHGHPQLRDRIQTLRVAIHSIKTPTSRDQLTAAIGKDPRAGADRCERRRRTRAIPVRFTRARLLVSAHLPHWRDHGQPRRPGRNFWPVLSVMTFRTPEEASSAPTTPRTG